MTFNIAGIKLTETDLLIGGGIIAALYLINHGPRIGILSGQLAYQGVQASSQSGDGDSISTTCSNGVCHTYRGGGTTVCTNGVCRHYSGTNGGISCVNGDCTYTDYSGGDSSVMTDDGNGAFTSNDPQVAQDMINEITNRIRRQQRHMFDDSEGNYAYAYPAWQGRKKKRVRKHKGYGQEFGAAGGMHPGMMMHGHVNRFGRGGMHKGMGAPPGMPATPPVPAGGGIGDNSDLISLIQQLIAQALQGAGVNAAAPNGDDMAGGMPDMSGMGGAPDMSAMQDQDASAYAYAYAAKDAAGGGDAAGGATDTAAPTPTCMTADQKPCFCNTAPAADASGGDTGGDTGGAADSGGDKGAGGGGGGKKKRGAGGGGKKKKKAAFARAYAGGYGDEFYANPGFVMPDFRMWLSSIFARWFPNRNIGPARLPPIPPAPMPPGQGFAYSPNNLPGIAYAGDVQGLPLDDTYAYMTDTQGEDSYAYATGNTLELSMPTNLITASVYHNNPYDRSSIKLAG